MGDAFNGITLYGSFVSEQEAMNFATEYIDSHYDWGCSHCIVRIQDKSSLIHETAA
jgi:hypothetical protein